MLFPIELGGFLLTDPQPQQGNKEAFEVEAEKGSACRVNVVAGGIKERGLAEQAYESLYAYLASDIAEGEGGNGPAHTIGTTAHIM